MLPTVRLSSKKKNLPFLSFREHMSHRVNREKMNLNLNEIEIDASIYSGLHNWKLFGVNKLKTIGTTTTHPVVVGGVDH